MAESQAANKFKQQQQIDQLRIPIISDDELINVDI